MKKLFICLANSKKYTQRCIAGVELTPTTRRGYRYDIVRREGKPVWVRPVSDGEYGAVATEWVDHINLLDIVAVNVAAPAPQGYQSENVRFEGNCLEIVEHIYPTPVLMDKLLAVDEPVLFGDKKNAIPTTQIGQIDHSLLLIKPASLDLHCKPGLTGPHQLRAIFLYGLGFYNLPITDIDFIEHYRHNPALLEDCEHIYLTISLGMAFNERHYKLVAGIIYF